MQDLGSESLANVATSGTYEKRLAKSVSSAEANADEDGDLVVEDESHSLVRNGRWS